MTARYRTLLSETIRCARQQKRAGLFMLLLSLVNYFYYTRGTWVAPVPTADSMKIFLGMMFLHNLLVTLLITTPWLLLTHNTLQHHSFTLPHLIKSSWRIFPKLYAVQMLIPWLLLTFLALISALFTAIVLAQLLKVTGMITVPLKVTSFAFLMQLLTCKFWIAGVVLVPTLLIWCFSCRILFAPYLIITKPQTGVCAVLCQSWQLSKPCLLHLLVATLLLNFFIFLPAYGLALSALRTNPWVNIGHFLCVSTIGLFSHIYFFVLYQQQTGKSALTHLTAEI